MIHVSAVLGGPELGPSSNVMRCIAAISFPVPGEPWPRPAEVPAPEAYRERRDPRPVGSLDIVFHVPGSILNPEHEGLRTGTFSRKQRMLQVQVAVPEHLMESQQLGHFLFQSIRQAILLAEPRFTKAAIPFPVAEYLGQVGELETRLRLGSIH